MPKVLCGNGTKKLDGPQKAVFNRVLLFYLVSAVVTLFFNLLRNPLDDQSADDLRLLESIPNFVSVDRARSSIPPHVLDLNTFDDFVAEVIRLSKCAMTMAGHVK